MKKELFRVLFLFLILSASQQSKAQGLLNNGTPPSVLATLDSTNLPIVFINTNFQSIVDQPKITANMAILDKGYNLFKQLF